jgi:hypothetical protein
MGFTMGCGSFYFQQVQQSNFNKTTGSYLSLQKKFKTLDDDLRFLKHYDHDLSFLKKRGWFKPQSRLIAAEKIKQAAASLNKISFIFEPETIEEDKNGYPFKVTKVILETSTLLDTSIYDFTANLLKNFPGILILRKLSLTRNEALNENSLLALRQYKRPDFIRGEIIFEWVAMGDKNDEN